MKTFDVETTTTYKTWVRVEAEDEFAAQKKVNDAQWDITAIQYQSMTSAEATGTVHELPLWVNTPIAFVLRSWYNIY